MRYKDKTFCEFKDCEKWEGCEHALTDDVRKKAGDWWEKCGEDRDNAPISIWFSMPGCHSKKFAI